MRYVTSLDPSQWPAAKIKFYKQSDGELFVEEDNPFGNIDLYGTGISLVDFNGDGLTDAVCGGADGLKALVQQNGRFDAPALSIMPLSAIDVQKGCPDKPCAYIPVLLDWDGDGDLDLALIQRYTPEAPRFFEHQNGLVTELPDHPFGNLSNCDVEHGRGFFE